MAKIYVIDQNVMQRPELPRFFAEHPDAKYVVPDTGLVEMVKSEKWEYTFKRNFAALVPVVTRCFMSLSVQEAREYELKRRVSIEGQLLPDDFTCLLRGAIVGSQPGNDNATMQQLRRKMDGARAVLAAEDLNGPVLREELTHLIAEARSKLTLEELRACKREGQPGRLSRLGITRDVGDALYVAHMRNMKVPLSVSRRLWKTGGMHRRWAYMLVHQAMQWLGEGGLESAPDKTVLNDILDQDYVLMASFFDGLLSIEKGSLRAYEDLCILLKLPPGVNAPVWIASEC
ncbi:MAG: hypothetical protein WA174_00220 [Rhodoferax sp.]